MKNILIIRSANFNVIDILVNYIYINNKKESINLYFLIQPSAIRTIKEKVPDAKVFTLPEGNINYKKFKQKKELLKKLNEIQYDEIYIPSSYEDFDNFEEVKLIACKINKKKVVLFNKYGKVFEAKLSFRKLYFYYKVLFPFRYIISLLITGAVYILAILDHLIRYHILRKEI